MWFNLSIVPFLSRIKGCICGRTGKSWVTPYSTVSINGQYRKSTQSPLMMCLHSLNALDDNMLYLWFHAFWYFHFGPEVRQWYVQLSVTDASFLIIWTYYHFKSDLFKRFIKELYLKFEHTNCILYWYDPS